MNFSEPVVVDEQEGSTTWIPVDHPPIPFAYLLPQDPPSSQTPLISEPVSTFRGFRWSPDGTTLLTCTQRATFGLQAVTSTEFWSSSQQTLPTVPSTIERLEVAPFLCEHDTVFDFAWYPCSDPLDASTWCFVTSTKDHPVHLWNIWSPTFPTASYVSYDHRDELITPACLSFSPDGQHLYCGYSNAVRIFDITRPGRDCEVIPLCPTRRSKEGQKGIVSSIAVYPHNGPETISRTSTQYYAVGTFTGSIGVYSNESVFPIAVLPRVHCSGVNHLQFTQNGQWLVSSGRRGDPHLLVWDVRNFEQPLWKLTQKITPTSNRRNRFDLHCTGRYMVNGNHSGCVEIFDLLTGQNVCEFAVESVKMYPCNPVIDVGFCTMDSSMLAICSSNLTVGLPEMEMNVDCTLDQKEEPHSCIRLWTFPPPSPSLLKNGSG